MIKKIFFITLALLPILSAGAFNDPKIDTDAILHNAPALDPLTLNTAIKGYHWALHHYKIPRPNILTVIDFTQHSYQKRLWVIDLTNGNVLLNTYTAHGKGSGLADAHAFSNTPNSHATSLGAFKTENTYYGHHGLSLRLEGLEKGINDNAHDRAVVVHGADYASKSFIESHHRAGRSWGCFAVDPKINKKLINLIKNGTVIFAFAEPELHDPNLEGVE